MTAPFSERVTVGPSTAVAARMWRSMWRQHRYNPRCSDEPRLDGAVALVTGGGRGIGADTSRGLAARGATVFSASRRIHPAQIPAAFVALDLADLTSLDAALADLAARLAGRALDIVIANAGLWPTQCAQSAQGHEMAFATNLLGHHALLRGLQRRNLLAADARLVILTGDIYIMASDCTPDFRFRGALGGQQAYCRSKLGNLWQMRELARRHPTLRVHAVHPGVIASELAGSGTGLVGAVKRAVLLSTEDGAQTSLYCATQPGLVSGTYFHNTMGRVALRADDPAADDRRAKRMWDTLEGLSQAFG